MPDPSTFRIRRLDNGLTLVFEAMPWLPTASFTALLPIGAVTDPHGLDGSSAVLFDWLQRGAGDLDSRAYSDALDALGARRGGSAGREYTTFSASCLADTLSEVLELMALALTAPRLETGEFEAARSLALQERLSIEDHPDQKLFEELGRHFFRSAHRRSPYGSESGLTALTAAGVGDDFRRRVGPEGAVLGVAGGVAWEALVDAVEAVLGSWSGATVASPEVDVDVAHYGHVEEDTAQVQIGFAYPAVAPNDPHRYHHILSLNVLSGSSGSRLNTEVREKRGLVYSVGASSRAVRGFGYVVGYAGTTPDRAEQTLAVTRTELNRLGAGVEAAELERARTGLLSHLVMQGESSSARASALVQDVYLRGAPRSLAETRARLEALTLEDINAFLRDRPDPDPTVLTLGPVALEPAAAVGGGPA